MLTHTIKKLKSGLTVVQVPMSSINSITVLALVNTGSRYEQEKEWGISHFLEHMVFKGTASYPTAQDLSAAVDAVGAKFNAFTSKEYTGFYVKAASQHFGLALDVVSDMLLTPKLQQKDIDGEKRVIIEEINMYADMPAAQISNLFEEMMFDRQTLGHDVIGTKETVSNIKQADFETYIRRWYGLNNIVLVLAGDASLLDQSSTLQKVEEMFAKGDVGKREVTHPADHLGPHPLTNKKLHVEHKKTEQAHFVLGFPGLKTDDQDRFAAGLLSIIMGASMSSRLFSEVREKRGLCYYIHSDNDSYHDVGIFGASAGVDPKRVEEAIEVTLKEFLAVVNGQRPISDDDLKKAKDFVAGKLTLDLEDSESVAQYFGMKQLLRGHIDDPDQLLKKYAAVTLEQIHQVARKLIRKEEIRFAIIGPFEDKEVFSRLLSA